MEPTRLATLLASVSLVADAGYGLAPGDSMRASAIAVRLADAVGASEAVAREAFFTSLLRHVGCVGFAHEMAAMFGDDLQANEAGSRTNFARRSDVFTTLLPGIVAGGAPGTQLRRALRLVTRGPRIGAAYETATCEVGRETARRMGLGGGVQRSLFEVYEWWNGNGNPRGLAGESIAPGARLARIATDAAVFHRLGGPDAAVAAMAERKSKILEPHLVECMAASAKTVFAGLTDADPRELALESEPPPHTGIGATDILAIAESLADLADLKSVFMAAHSREVARLAVGAAERLDLGDGDVRTVRLAGLLHDLGRVAITNRIWEKQGSLTSVEWDEVHLHPFHGERLLRGCAPFADAAAIVGRHHERLDGSGYHRGDRGRSIGIAARILAAADVFQAMTQDRPHREARLPAQASVTLSHMVQDRQLDGDAVAAVLAAAGERVTAPAVRERPAGLTSRELDVLGQVARGLPNAEVGRVLGISRRTAEHHLQRAYQKIGVSSRAAVTLFAVEHDLLRPDIAQPEDRLGGHG